MLFQKIWKRLLWAPIAMLWVGCQEESACVYGTLPCPSNDSLKIIQKNYEELDSIYKQAKETCKDDLEEQCVMDFPHSDEERGEWTLPRLENKVYSLKSILDQCK